MTKRLQLTKKPAACQGCPHYGDGTGFAADEVNAGASILFIGARPDEQGEVTGMPFTGRTGKMIEANIGKYGLSRTDASWANVTRCRFNHTGEKPANFYDAALYCGQAFPRPNPKDYKVIVPLDDEALMVVAGLNDVEVWRGSPIIADAGYGRSSLVIPTPHPSAIFAKPRLRTASKSDFGRIYQAARNGRGAFTYADEFHQAADPDWFLENFAVLAAHPEQFIVIDIETDKRKPVDATVRIFGVGWAKDRAANVSWEALNELHIDRIRYIIRDAKCRFVTATPFDYTTLSKYGFKFAWENCHDLTLLHSRYDIELPHTVAFIASTWTYRKFWKWLNESDPYYYNCLDCAGEWEAWTKLYSYCKTRDQEVLACYEQDRAQTRTAGAVHLAGMPLDGEQFKFEKRLYTVVRDNMEVELNEAFTKDHPTPVEPPKCEKHKRYSGRTGLKLRKGETATCSLCSGMREYFLSSKPLNLRSHKQMMKLLKDEGIKIPKTRDKTTHRMKESMDKAAIKKMAVANEDIRLFNLLDFRQRDKVASTYFKESKVSADNRVHANFHMHGAMHRWHSTDPNQQQVKRPERLCENLKCGASYPGTELTECPKCGGKVDVHGPRRAYVTGVGRTFLAFDADGLHYRIAGVLSGDPFISHTLARYDAEKKPEFKPHIVNTQALFKVDKFQALAWMGVEAPQYVFAKNFIYMILNWGDTMALAQAAVTAGLSLNVEEVDTLKNNWLEKAHYYREWRARLLREAEKSGMVSLFDGRRRRYYGLRWKDGKWHADHDTQKEIGNHPLIGTEVSYINPRLTKVMDYCEATQWKLVLLSHDGFMLEGPKYEVKHASSVLYPEMSKAWMIDSHKSLVVPWTAKEGNCWATLESLSMAG